MDFRGLIHSGHEFLKQHSKPQLVFGDHKAIEHVYGFESKLFVNYGLKAESMLTIEDIREANSHIPDPIGRIVYSCNIRHIEPLHGDLQTSPCWYHIIHTMSM